MSTSADMPGHNLNQYRSKNRIVRRVLFEGRQYAGESSTVGTPPEISIPFSSSNRVSKSEPLPTSVLVLPTSVDSQLPSHASDTISLGTTPLPTQRVTDTVTISLSETVIATITYGTAVTASTSPQNSAVVQSAQGLEQNRQLLPVDTVGAVIMSVLFVVMMGFVLYVARKRFGFPRGNNMKQLRNDAMAARLANTISEHPRSFGGRRPTRPRSLRSLVTFSSLRRGRARPDSETLGLPPFPAGQASTSMAGPSRPQASMPSASRKSSSDMSSSAGELYTSFHAFLAVGDSSENRISGNTRQTANAPNQQPATSCTAIPDDLDTPIFLTGSPKRFDWPKK